MAIDIACVAPTGSQVGEGAVWDVVAQCLWWVDIPAGVIYRYDPASGENRSIHYGEPVGCLAVREQGGLVLATKSGFCFFDPDSGTRKAINDPEAHMAENRFNDGTTDSKGRFWAGTMKDGGTPEALGSFYRLDKDLTVTRWKSEFFTTNGLAFSPSGNRMYFAESHRSIRTIWACDYDIETGTPAEPEVFFDTTAVAGRPDGGTVDSEGCYWQAGVDGWQIYRLSPAGEVMMTVDLPVERPSKPMFGGANLDILYVTSIGVGLTEGSNQPDAGGLFAITGLDVTGVRQFPFGG